MTTNMKAPASPTTLARKPYTGPVVQKGPIFFCFTCAAQARGLATWADSPRLSGYAPLDAWGNHIAYLNLPTCPPEHERRVAKLGDCITPLVFVERAARGEWAKAQEANIQAVQRALAAIAAAVPDDERVNDAATDLIYSVVGGLITPSNAVAKLRVLLGVAADFRKVA